MTSAKDRYDREVSDAAQALIDWFMSQTIKPEESVDVMIVVIASILTGIDENTSEKKLHEKIDRIHEILTHYADKMEPFD